MNNFVGPIEFFYAQFQVQQNLQQFHSIEWDYLAAKLFLSFSHPCLVQIKQKSRSDFLFMPPSELVQVQIQQKY